MGKTVVCAWQSTVSQIDRSKRVCLLPPAQYQFSHVRDEGKLNIYVAIILTWKYSRTKFLNNAHIHGQ